MVSLQVTRPIQTMLLEPLTASEEQVPRLNRQQLVEQIMTHNTSATPGFLRGFSDAALVLYLDHLQQGLEPRGAQSRWIRKGETPAIVGRASRDEL